MLRIAVNAAAPEPDAIARAAAVLRRGGLAAIPTDTLYGLAADPFSAEAVSRIFVVKRRESERAIPLVAADLNQLRRSIGPPTSLAERLAIRFWPGPLTLVVDAPPTLAPEVTGGSGTVAVRVPSHAVTRALCAACGVPLTATSANVSGEPPTNDPDVVGRSLGSLLDLLIDAGFTPGGAPSTIVDATGSEPRLIRAGAIAWDAVLTEAKR
jgi:L-threonylcarbamoyladenylate synthase